MLRYIFHIFLAKGRQLQCKIKLSSIPIDTIHRGSGRGLYIYLNLLGYFSLLFLIFFLPDILYFSISYNLFFFFICLYLSYAAISFILYFPLYSVNRKTRASYMANYISYSVHTEDINMKKKRSKGFSIVKNSNKRRIPLWTKSFGF